MASLKQMTQTALIGSVLDHIVSHYAPGRMEEMQKDVVLSDIFNQFFDPTEKVVKKKKAPVKKKAAAKKAEVSPKVSLEDRQEAGVDESKCLCRIWKNGLDNVQCSRSKKDGDFCGAHIKKGAANGEWWLGLVTESRPEEPMGPPGSKKGPSRHYWTGQDQPEKRSRKKTPVSEAVELTVSEAVELTVSEETVSEETVSEEAVELTVSEEAVEMTVSEEAVELTVSDEAVELTVSDLVDAMVEKTVSEADAAGVGSIPPTSHMESESSTLDLDDSPVEYEVVEESDDDAPDEISDSDSEEDE